VIVSKAQISAGGSRPKTDVLGTETTEALNGRGHDSSRSKRSCHTSRVDFEVLEDSQSEECKSSKPRQNCALFSNALLGVDSVPHNPGKFDSLAPVSRRRPTPRYLDRRFAMYRNYRNYRNSIFV
jgi:hypothetical protein